MKLLLILLILFTAQAHSSSNIDLGLGATFPQTHTAFNNEANTDIAGFLNYRFNTSERVSIGAGVYFLNFSDTELKDEALYFLGRYDFSTKDYFRLFTVAGLGVANISPDEAEDYGRFTALLGVGIDSRLNDDFRIGLNMNYHHLGKFDNAKTEQHILVPSVFLTYTPNNKSPKKKSQLIRKNTPKVSDLDKDGVSDRNDQCPETLAGVKVNMFGCDNKRKNTSISLNVKFLPEKTEIDNRSTAKVDKLANVLKENKDLIIEIQGHTDTSGSRRSNILISEKRARAVREYLIKKHDIDGKRLKAKGYGPEIPLKSNETYEGREANRRVEVKILSFK